MKPRSNPYSITIDDNVAYYDVGLFMSLDATRHLVARVVGKGTVAYSWTVSNSSVKRLFRTINKLEDSGIAQSIILESGTLVLTTVGKKGAK